VLGRLAGEIDLNEQADSSIGDECGLFELVAELDAVDGVDRVESLAGLPGLVGLQVTDRCQRKGKSERRSIFWIASWTLFSPKSTWPASAPLECSQRRRFSKQRRGRWRTDRVGRDRLRARCVREHQPIEPEALLSQALKKLEV
jgi:hypothetical protein